MFPGGGSFSTVTTASPYLSPDNLNGFTRQVDYEQGGAGLHNAAGGIRYQTWRVSWDPASHDVTLYNEDGFEQVMFNQRNVTQLALSFDQSMTPYFAYTVKGVTWLRWLLVSGETQKMIIPGALQPRLTLDDKRPESSTIADVLLFYLRGRSICMRVQRERFLVEHVLAVDVIGTRLGRVGMTKGLRVQVELLP